MQPRFGGTMKNSPLLDCPVPSGLIAYSLPIVFSMLTTQLYSAADSMLLGLLEGPKALAGASNASVLLMLVLVVSGGLELGGSLYVGARAPTSSGKELSDAVLSLLLLSLFFSLPLTALVLTGFPRLLSLIQTPAEILPQAALYGRIYSLSLPFIMLYDLSRQVLMACGDSRLPMRMVVFTSAANLLLDVPAIRLFGAAGAAGASAIAQTAGCLWALSALRKKALLPEAAPAPGAHMAGILRLSLPNMLQQAAIPFLGNIQQSFLGLLGTSAIAGFACASKLTALIPMTLGGFVQGLVLFLVQNQAAGQSERARYGQRAMTRVILLLDIGLIVLLELLSRPLTALFTRDPGVFAMGHRLLVFTAPACLLSGLRFLAEARLRVRGRMGAFALSTLFSSAVSVACIGLLLRKMGLGAFILGPYLGGFLGLLFSLFLERTCR